MPRALGAPTCVETRYPPGIELDCRRLGCETMLFHLLPLNDRCGSPSSPPCAEEKYCSVPWAMPFPPGAQFPPPCPPYVGHCPGIPANDVCEFPIIDCNICISCASI